MKKGINVLSLFNGMSTGHVAMDNLGIKRSESNRYNILNNFLTNKYIL